MSRKKRGDGDKDVSDSELSDSSRYSQEGRRGRRKETRDTEGGKLTKTGRKRQPGNLIGRPTGLDKMISDLSVLRKRDQLTKSLHRKFSMATKTSDGSHDGSSSPSPRKVTKVGDSAFVTDAGGRLHGPVPIEEDTNKAGGDGAMFDRAQSRSPSLSRQRRRKSAAKKDTQRHEVVVLNYNGVKQRFDCREGEIRVEEVARHFGLKTANLQLLATSPSLSSVRHSIVYSGGTRGTFKLSETLDALEYMVAGFPATKDQDMAFSDGDDINSGEDYDQSHLESPGSQKRRIKRRIAEKARKVAEREEHRRHRRRRDRERRLRRREERMGIKSGRDGSEDSSEDSFGSPPRRHRDSNRLASPYSTPPSSPHRRSTKKKSKREDRGRHRSSSKYTRLSNSPSPRAERNRKAATYRESLRQARKSIHRQSPSPPLKTGNQRRKQSKSGGSAEKENGENGEEKKKEAFRHRRSANDVKINITRGFLNKKSGRWVTLDDSRFLSIGRETISYNAVMFEMNFQFRTLEEDASYGLVLCTRSGQRIRDGTALSDPAYWEGAGHHAAIRVHPCVSEEDMSRKEARLAKRQELLGACSEGEEPTLPAPVSSMPEADGDQEEGEHGGGEHGGGEHGGGEHGEAAESPEAPEAPPPPPRPQAFYIDCEHLRCRVCLQMAVEPVLCRVTGDISGCRTCITRLRRNARNNRCPRCQDPDCYGTRLTIVKGLDKLCREGRALESEVAERFNHETTDTSLLPKVR